MTVEHGCHAALWLEGGANGVHELRMAAAPPTYAGEPAMIEDVSGSGRIERR